MDTLRQRLGGVAIDDDPNADTLGIALVSYFEGHRARPADDPETEHGWGEWATAKMEQALDRISAEMGLEARKWLWLNHGCPAYVRDGRLVTMDEACEHRLRHVRPCPCRSTNANYAAREIAGRTSRAGRGREERA